MRIRLTRGKQKEIILKAKANLSWNELGEKIGISGNYLQRDLKYEKITLPLDSYKILCRMIGKSYDQFVTEELTDTWGKSKGGLNSRGSLISLSPPREDERLAEFVGAVLGDGNITFYNREKGIGVYHVKIAGDLIKDKEYHLYLKGLAEGIFKLNVREYISKRCNGRYISINSKELVEFFREMGLKPGNKIKNQTTIPSWIWKNEDFLKGCLRGLIDTDGSVFRMSNQDPNLIRIGFTNHNKRLLEDTRKAFIILGFNPSKIIQDRQFHLSRKEDIKKYLKEVGFSNNKHLLRLNKFS